MLKLAGIDLGETPSYPQAYQLLHFQLSCDGLSAQRNFCLQFSNTNNNHLEMLKTDHSPESLSQSCIAHSPFLRILAGQGLLAEQTPIYQMLVKSCMVLLFFFHNSKIAVNLSCWRPCNSWHMAWAQHRWWQSEHPPMLTWKYTSVMTGNNMHEPRNFQKIIETIKPFHMSHSAFKVKWAGVESECSAVFWKRTAVTYLWDLWFSGINTRCPLERFWIWKESLRQYWSRYRDAMFLLWFSSCCPDVQHK